MEKKWSVLVKIEFAFNTSNLIYPLATPMVGMMSG